MSEIDLMTRSGVPAAGVATPHRLLSALTAAVVNPVAAAVSRRAAKRVFGGCVQGGDELSRIRSAMSGRWSLSAVVDISGPESPLGAGESPDLSQVWHRRGLPAVSGRAVR